ncbi:MAG: hypothetical protein K2K56_03825 [Lachnospiraceae bacterium]|nr:hypothetical protein [Lachnospiraceae bacterium]
MRDKQNDKKDVVTIVVKKSGMVVREEEYDRLVESQEGFLDCIIEETEEELQFTYNKKHVTPLRQLRKDDKLKQMVVLGNVKNVQDLRKQYSFSMNPDNLYYDMKGNVYVMHRDIVSKDYSGKQEHFIEEYKSLIGYVMQSRYDYEDYLEGGQALLRKDKFLNKILEAESVDAILTALEEQYEKIVEERNVYYVEVKRAVYKRKNGYIVFASLLITVLLGGLLYLYFYKVEEQKHMLEVYGNYLVEDYVSLIDAGRGIRTENLDSRQKYVLAVAYVKSEDLTAEQKDNILALLLPEGSEQISEYWIELGRGNVTEAENIAMQRSDDELLLYAYLKEKQQLEENTELTGTEKNEAITNLQSKIDSLAEQYSVEEEENE